MVGPSYQGIQRFYLLGPRRVLSSIGSCPFLRLTPSPNEPDHERDRKQSKIQRAQTAPQHLRFALHCLLLAQSLCSESRQLAWTWISPREPEIHSVAARS